MSYKLLIVIDVQNDFVYGSLGTDEARNVVPNIVDKVDWYRKNGYSIIFTQDTHGENYLSTPEGIKLPVPHCIEGTWGHDIIDELNVVEDENNYKERSYFKDTFGYRWENAPWISFKKHMYDVEIVGLCTDICVVSNALILKSEYPLINITVDAACCAGTTPEKHKAALEVMKSCQIDVIGG